MEVTLLINYVNLLCKLVFKNLMIRYLKKG